MSSWRAVVRVGVVEQPREAVPQPGDIGQTLQVINYLKIHNKRLPQIYSSQACTISEMQFDNPPTPCPTPPTVPYAPP